MCVTSNMSYTWWQFNERDLAKFSESEREVLKELHDVRPNPRHPKWHFAIGISLDSGKTTSQVTCLILRDFSPEMLNFIVRLPALQTLNLDGSETKPALPLPPGELPNLQVLVIGQFSSLPIETWVEKVPNLETLGLGEVPSLILPETIKRLTRLKNLFLSNNLHVHLPDALGNMSNLQELHLRKNNLTHLPASIQNLRELTVFDINDNAFEYFPWQVGYCEKLRRIRVMRNPWFADASVFLTKYGLARRRTEIAKGDIKRFLAECRDRYDAIQRKMPPPSDTTQINGIRKLFES